MQDNSAAGNLADDSPFFMQRAQKSQQFGIFAELLKALGGKELAPEEGEAAAGFPGTENAGEKGFAWHVSGLSQTAEESEPLPVPAPVFDGEGIFGGVSGSFRQGLLAEQDSGEQGQTALSDYPWPIKPGKNGVPELFTKSAEESPDFDHLPSHFGINRPEIGSQGGDMADTPDIMGAETLLARHSGSEPSQAVFNPDFAKAASGETDKALLAELREKKGKEQPVIEVLDLRTAEGRSAANADEANQGLSRQASQQAAHTAYSGAGLEGLTPTHPELGISVDLNPSPQLGDGWTARKTGREFSQGRLFEDALARELRGNLSMDIVKNASLIVRNGGEGTIRLALNPASLGNVKIHLEMSENKIMGHIIVESNDALRAFQRELPALERAFRDSGFIETSLDMSLAQEGGEFGDDQHQWPEGNFPALDPALAAARYDAGMESELVEDTAASGNALLSASTERKTVNLFI